MDSFVNDNMFKMVKYYFKEIIPMAKFEKTLFQETFPTEKNMSLLLNEVI